MRVLVTGGFGYLGGRIAQFLSDQPGIEVVIGSRRPAQSVPQTKAQSVQIDWSDAHSLADACRGIDVVVHAAGMNAADCAADPEAALAFNGAATGALAKAAASAGVQRFIYLSTVHVYAAPLVGTFDEQSPLLNPHPYATSHAAGEAALFESAVGSNMVPLVLRLSNAFGAPIHAETKCWTLLLNDVARQIAEVGQITLLSAGNQYRNFVPISFVCQAVLLFVQRPFSGVFNVAAEHSVSVRDMVEDLARAEERRSGIRPPIAPDGNGSYWRAAGLIIKIAQLMATGLLPVSDKQMEEEMDNLLSFCQNHRAHSDREKPHE